MSIGIIAKELKQHAPFTALGTLTGIVLMAVLIQAQIPGSFSALLFWTCHPAHVFLSALVTTAMYRLHGNKGFRKTLVIGYLGSVGIATLSDSIIPYIGEILLELPHREIHLGFIEKWWLVNPLAFAGIAWACVWPKTKFPHAAHVLLSTWASLFHITMAMGTDMDTSSIILTAVFLFLAVWIPCCTSDIVFPLIFSKDRRTYA
jgi:hypothetical protein